MSVSCHRFPLWRQNLRSLWRVGDYDFVFCVNGPILTSGMNFHAPIKYLIFCKVIRWRQHNYKKLVTNVHYLFTWRLAPTFNRYHQHRNSVTKIMTNRKSPTSRCHRWRLEKDVRNNFEAPLQPGFRINSIHAFEAVVFHLKKWILLVLY